jgi:uncharacterized protein (TIGR02466 family)
MTKVIGLFPTPLMRVDRCLGEDLIEAFVERARGLERQSNTATDLLSHTEMLEPGSDASCERLARIVTPHLVQFGALLFAKDLRWFVKELWLNVLERGGNQFMHTHANSFVSGIVYLTKPHPSASTVFRKVTGGGEFIFKNDVPLGHFSSDTWILSDIEAGDLVLYPSYVLHGVPPNDGEQRITLAFNAVPERLDSLGYKVSFGP